MGEEKKSIFETELDYKKGGVILGIMLVLLVIPALGYGRAWAFAGGLRWIDKTIIGAISPDTIAGNPFWRILKANPEVALMLAFFVLGSFVAAVLSKEFVIGMDKQFLLESIVGGFLMGVGIVLITTCNVGCFLNGLPQLNLGAMIAGVGLIIGTYIGGKYYEKKVMSL